LKGTFKADIGVLGETLGVHLEIWGEMSRVSGRITIQFQVRDLQIKQLEPEKFIVLNIKIVNSIRF
jgi:hypothetical protein